MSENLWIRWEERNNLNTLVGLADGNPHVVDGCGEVPHVAAQAEIHRPACPCEVQAHTVHPAAPVLRRRCELDGLPVVANGHGTVCVPVDCCHDRLPGCAGVPEGA